MGADSVGGQLRRDKECPFSGVTNSGKVWWKVPESDARSVAATKATRLTQQAQASVPAGGDSGGEEPFGCLVLDDLHCTATFAVQRAGVSVRE